MPTLDQLEKQARAVALGDVYVLTNQIHDLLEERLGAIQRAVGAIQRAVGAGATEQEVAGSMKGRASLWA